MKVFWRIRIVYGLLELMCVFKSDYLWLDTNPIRSIHLTEFMLSSSYAVTKAAKKAHPLSLILYAHRVLFLECYFLNMETILAILFWYITQPWKTKRLPSETLPYVSAIYAWICNATTCVTDGANLLTNNIKTTKNSKSTSKKGRKGLRHGVESPERGPL